MPEFELVADSEEERTYTYQFSLHPPVLDYQNVQCDRVIVQIWQQGGESYLNLDLSGYQLRKDGKPDERKAGRSNSFDLTLRSQVKKQFGELFPEWKAMTDA